MLEYKLFPKAAAEMKLTTEFTTGFKQSGQQPTISRKIMSNAVDSDIYTQTSLILLKY